MSHSDPPVTNLSEVTDPVLNQSDAEETPPYHNSGFLSNRSNIGLTVGVIIAALVVAIIITLAVVFGFVRHMKNQKNEVPMATNEAYGTGLQDMITYTEGDTYDYPSVNDQAKSFIDTKINEAYATNAEAKPCIAYATGVETKPCVAYATNIIADRNDTYDIKLRDVAMQREGDTYD